MNPLVSVAVWTLYVKIFHVDLQDLFYDLTMALIGLDNLNGDRLTDFLSFSFAERCKGQ